MGNEKKTKKRPNKIVALVTYILALICLLLGLFLPANFADATGSMLGLQLPAAFDAIYKIGENGLQGMFNSPAFTYSFPFAVFGFPEGGIDLAAILAVLYALVTLAGVVALIPVFVSALGGRKGRGKKNAKGKKPENNAETEEEPVETKRSGKRDKNVALRAASFIEVLAMIVLTTFVLIYFNQLILAGSAISEFTNYGLMAAIGGTLLMLIVQAIFYKRGSGLMKLLLTVLSALTVILIYGVSFMLPFLADTVANLNLTLYTVGSEAPADVLTLINSLFTTGISFEQDAATITLELTAVIFGYLAFVNFVIDIMGLGKKTNKFMLIANIVRYALELAAILALIITVLVAKASLGNLAIAVAIIAALSLIFNIIRLAAYSAKRGKKAKKGEKAKKEKVAKQPAKEKPAKREPVPAPVAAEATPEVAKTEPEQKLYNPVIYNGPTDDFIRTLSNDQKVEFSKIFLEREQGPIPCIPDYSVGGKNDKFFASIFIYYARVRDLISDELMNNLYKQANVM